MLYVLELLIVTCFSYLLFNTFLLVMYPHCHSLCVLLPGLVGHPCMIPGLPMLLGIKVCIFIFFWRFLVDKVFVGYYDSLIYLNCLLIIRESPFN